jgi:cytochrome c oxidase subunit 4
MSETKQHHHVLPLSTYLTVGGALLLLTCVTVLVSQFQFGEWNLIVAMAVAALKATLVLLFFMHLKYDNKLYAFAFLISITFLAVFITFTMLDTMTRDEFGRGSIDKQVLYKAAPIHPEGATEGHAAASADSSAKAGTHSADSVKTESHK